jgi:hypothetical protein
MLVSLLVQSSEWFTSVLRSKGCELQSNSRLFLSSLLRWKVIALGAVLLARNTLESLLFPGCVFRNMKRSKAHTCIYVFSAANSSRSRAILSNNRPILTLIGSSLIYQQITSRCRCSVLKVLRQKENFKGLQKEGLTES